MSVAKFESEVKHILQPAEAAYARLSDLKTFETIKDNLNDPAVRERMGDKVPADKFEEVKKYVDGMEFTSDTLSISSPMGNILLRVVEREEPKLVKLASEGAPVQLYVWIQILPEGESGAKLRVTVGAEVNFFMKSMVAKPLQQAADGLATMLAAGF